MATPVRDAPDLIIEFLDLRKVALFAVACPALGQPRQFLHVCSTRGATPQERLGHLTDSQGLHVAQGESSASHASVSNGMLTTNPIDIDLDAACCSSSTTFHA